MHSKCYLRLLTWNFQEWAPKPLEKKWKGFAEISSDVTISSLAKFFNTQDVFNMGCLIAAYRIKFEASYRSGIGVIHLCHAKIYNVNLPRKFAYLQSRIIYPIVLL